MEHILTYGQIKSRLKPSKAARKQEVDHSNTFIKTLEVEMKEKTSGEMDIAKKRKHNNAKQITSRWLEQNTVVLGKKPTTGDRNQSNKSISKQKLKSIRERAKHQRQF